MGARTLLRRSPLPGRRCPRAHASGVGRRPPRRRHPARRPRVRRVRSRRHPLGLRARGGRDRARRARARDRRAPLHRAGPPVRRAPRHGGAARHRMGPLLLPGRHPGAGGRCHAWPCRARQLPRLRCRGRRGRDRRRRALGCAAAPVGEHRRPSHLRDGRPGVAPPGRGVRRRLRAALRPGVLRDLRRNRVRAVQLADAARRGGCGLRRPRRAHAVQRGRDLPVGRRHRLLLREHPPPPHPRRGRAARLRPRASRSCRPHGNGSRAGWSPSARRCSSPSPRTCS